MSAVLHTPELNRWEGAGLLPGAEVSVALARGAAEVRESQRLRYEVFALESGAQLHSQEPGLDVDVYDRDCQHMLVRDAGGRLIASTRLLSSEDAAHDTGFYSQSEFIMDNILRLPGRLLEVGRTCVHPEHRNGATLSRLWHGVGQFAREQRVDWLFGCASIPLNDGGAQAAVLLEQMRARWSPAERRVYPLRPLICKDCAAPMQAPLPPLLKAYLNMGAEVCGEAYWDADFNVADVFVLIDTQRMSRRYARRFYQAPAAATGAA